MSITHTHTNLQADGADESVAAAREHGALVYLVHGVDCLGVTREAVAIGRIEE